MKIRSADLERLCDVMFDRWCAEELIDPRLREILEEAFVNGFMARDSLEYSDDAKPATKAVVA